MHINTPPESPHFPDTTKPLTQEQMAMIEQELAKIIHDCREWASTKKRAGKKPIPSETELKEHVERYVKKCMEHDRMNRAEAMVHAYEVIENGEMECTILGWEDTSTPFVRKVVIAVAALIVIVAYLLVSSVKR